MTTVEKSLSFTGTFEAEILTSLLLWRWDHPFKDDRDFANGLLEEAAVALHAAATGEQLLDTVPAFETNLIAAIYYAEWCAVISGAEPFNGKRRQWLENIMTSVPSCFCEQTDLPET